MDPHKLSILNYFPTPPPKKIPHVFSPNLGKLKFETPVSERRFMSPTTPFLGTPEMFGGNSKGKNSSEDREYEKFVGESLLSMMTPVSNRDSETTGMLKIVDDENGEILEEPGARQKRKDTIKSPCTDTIRKIRTSYFNKVIPRPPEILPMIEENEKDDYLETKKNTTKSDVPPKVLQDEKRRRRRSTEKNDNNNILKKPKTRKRSKDDEDFFIEDSELYKAPSSSEEDDSEEYDESFVFNNEDVDEEEEIVPTTTRRRRRRKKSSLSSSSKSSISSNHGRRGTRRLSLKEQPISDLKKKKRTTYQAKVRPTTYRKGRFSRSKLIEAVSKINLTKKKMTQLLNGNGSSRNSFPQPAQRVLKEWFVTHRYEPYPTTKQKAILERKTNLSIHQINDWFTNKRKRVWKPYVETLI